MIRRQSAIYIKCNVIQLYCSLIVYSSSFVMLHYANLSALADIQKSLDWGGRSAHIILWNIQIHVLYTRLLNISKLALNRLPSIFSAALSTTTNLLHIMIFASKDLNIIHKLWCCHKFILLSNESNDLWKLEIWCAWSHAKSRC